MPARGSRSRRLIRRAAIALAIGAAATVLVAWGLAATHGAVSATAVPSPAKWPVPVPESFGLAPVNTLADPASGRRMDMFNGRYVPGAPSSVSIWRYGWPALSLRVWKTDGPLAGPSLPMPGGWVRAQDRLPIEPVWPGFAVNTHVYAAAAFGVLSALPALRAARRRRHGRCVACGYDRAGLTAGGACPECGHVSLERR